MACRLVGAKPLSEPMLEYRYLDPLEQTSVNFDRKYNIFIQENAFESVVCDRRPFCLCLNVLTHCGLEDKPDSILLISF